jgi:hypothetical protein
VRCALHIEIRGGSPFERRKSKERRDSTRVFTSASYCRLNGIACKSIQSKMLNSAGACCWETTPSVAGKMVQNCEIVLHVKQEDRVKRSQTLIPFAQ